MLQFPKDFIWGAATSSYQIEGTATGGDKIYSIWDHFSRIPGKVANGDNGDIAIDHYNRYIDDVALMKALHLKAYRFSTSWARLYTETPGKFNEKGLDFYKRLVHELLENDIEPMLTIYHWDMPQALQEKGGWENRDIVHYFQEYAAFLYENLGDVVKKWITHNEPWVVTYLGYGNGEHAPGIQNFTSFLKAAHHVLLSHGEAVKAFRAIGPKNGEIGITLNLTPGYAFDPQDEKAVDAARKWDGFMNRWFLDPVFKGQYPKDMLEVYKDYLPNIYQEGDLQTIQQPIDFFGFNYYSTATLKDWKKGEREPIVFEHVSTGRPVTDMNWEVNPNGLFDLMIRLKNDYGDIPLYITENGAAYKDYVNEQGEVEDNERIAYIREHLIACHRAIERGVNLKGYYVWSLFDNFEWAFGYDKRFGIVYVDYETLARIPKKSALWYKETIMNHGVK
ncbi:beta-glucosidase [Anoxybacillus tengchongensis]|uniref:Beta-glucosidase n=1 Tax=Anoxybacillus tengchongensis TaxID=576944 RepID=A0A7X0DAX3_9BACL|nr:GH1 family beta-glucosidase [Anoxybacillus tengchongensis]MBB6176539.1 beta-glucosidase [Anoxybacillus tengchongensis]